MRGARPAWTAHLACGAGVMTMENEPEERVVWEPKRERHDAGQQPGRGPARGQAARVFSSAVEVPESVAGARWGVQASVLRSVALAALLLVVALGGWTWWSGRQAAPHPVERPADADVQGAETSPRGAAAGTDAVPGGAAPGEAAPGADPVPAETVASGEAGSAGAAGGDPAAPVPAGSQDPSPGANTGQDPASGAGSAQGAATVHVVGEVLRPGVVRVPAGSRVGDAVAAAGGLTGQADEQRLNLARPVTDGEQILVLRPGEEPPPPAAPPGGGAPGPGGPGGPATPAGVDAAGDDGPLDLNTADQDALEELPGVGPVTAEHILAWREENGQFTTVDELMEVSGIGEKTLATLRPHVRVG